MLCKKIKFLDEIEIKDSNKIKMSKLKDSYLTFITKLTINGSTK